MSALLLFFHMLGMLLLFVGFGVEWAASSSSAVRRFYGLGAGVLMLSGLVLAWRDHAFPSIWVRASLAVLLVMGGLGALRRSGTLAVRIALGLMAVYLMIAKP